LPPGRVGGDQGETRRGIAPDLFQIRSDGLDSLVVKPIDSPRSDGFLADEPRQLEESQVARYRRSTDRQGIGKLLDRPAAGAEKLDDRPPVRIAERVERIPRRKLLRSWSAQSARIRLFLAS
jgi:hypothetical protein